MLPTLKNHPFAVESHFENSLVLTYAVEKSELAGLIPECLELDLFKDKWAFLAVAIVDTRDLRPKGLPKFMGNDFILTGYRIFVRYKTSKGKNLRGLYILKSETNKNRMAFWGNIFTHYKYSTMDIEFKAKGNSIHVQSHQSDLTIDVELQNNNPHLPEGSPFADWKEARRFAGPLPFTFTYNDHTKQVLIIEGVRDHWIPAPVSVIKANVGFIKNKSFKNIILANAFLIQNVPYYWKKGKIDLWTR
jgi:uncharacterized protein YqjF (DUF2071 family)